uniref:Tandem C2 domains, nuclear n=1 Tax=Callorhinchus milii TaxID=7868 RepID=A0A4W3IIF2_CALMI|eukprot:gi/632979871/ref/XP_007906715.1/ PREDICTED: tandem C2 domains nuclear protein [Callorhinchus milii]
MAVLQTDLSAIGWSWLAVLVVAGSLMTIVLGLTADFIKDCCKKAFNVENEDHEEIPEEPKGASSLQEVTSGPMKMGCTEDILLSKLPLDGREVPFVVPNLQASYIQPNVQRNYSYAEAKPGFSRTSYVERKLEMTGGLQCMQEIDEVYNPNFVLQSVGASRGPGPLGNTAGPYGSVWDLRSPKLSGQAALSSSMFDLSTAQHRTQRFSSTSSINSSVSSMMDFQGSSRSLDSPLDDLGKLTLKLSYKPSREQIWITVVQVKDLYLGCKPTDKVNIYLKGTITLPKPVHFKTSVKEATSDQLFMETFVFNIKLSTLQTHGLVFKVVAQTSRKRPVGECSVSLRELSDVESDLCLEILPPSKTPTCHALLHIGTCFQAISNRIQLQVLEAQNLPTSSTPLTLNFFVKAMMDCRDGLINKKKTRPLKSVNGKVKWGETFLFPVLQNQPDLEGLSFTLKLYSRSSVRRKHLLGQVVIGSDSTGEAWEQWQDMAKHPEKVVLKWHKLNSS